MRRERRSCASVAGFLDPWQNARGPCDTKGRKEHERSFQPFEREPATCDPVRRRNGDRGARRLSHGDRGRPGRRPGCIGARMLVPEHAVRDGRGGRRGHQAGTAALRGRDRREHHLDSQPYNALQQKVFAELGPQSSFYDIIIVDTPGCRPSPTRSSHSSAYIEDAALTDPDLLALDDFIPKVFYDTAVYDHGPSNLEFPGDQSVVDLAAIKAAGFDIYGLPLQANALTMSYRSDLFGNPDEQAAFEAQYGRDWPCPRPGTSSSRSATFFTRPDENLYGTTLMAGSGDWATDDFKTLLAGFGGNGKMVDDTFARAFNSPEGDGRAPALPGPHQCPPGDATRRHVVLVGRGVCGVRGRPDRDEHELPQRGPVTGDVGRRLVRACAGRPDGARGPHFGTWMLSVNKFSENKACAWQAIQWLTSAETQTKMLATQLHPSRDLRLRGSGRPTRRLHSSATSTRCWANPSQSALVDPG